MATSIVPMLGAAGLWTLNAPWNADLLANTQYTCVAVRSLAEIVAGGGDPYTDYYVPKSIDQATYNTDLQNGVSVVSLQAANNSLVYVPTSYIASFPNGNGIPYRVMLLGISLSAIPDSLDLSAISQKIVDDVKDIIGVDSTVTSVAISPVTLLSTDDAAALEAARQANITNSTTDYAQLLAKTAAYDAAVQQISVLEAYIITLQGGTPPESPDITVPGEPSSNPSDGSST